MSESARHPRYSPAGPGAAFESFDDSPEQRIGQWRTESEYREPAELAVELDEIGIEPAELSDEDLMREMHSLHRTRLDTLRHAGDTALATHLRRTAELETEYLARHPEREVDAARLRDGT